MYQTIKLITISLLSFCLVTLANAQDAGNFAGTVLDLSRTYPGGTARIQGLGGAQTALGGDISAASSNPAGLGFFNRSELSFSPALNFINTSSTYLGTSVYDSKLNLNFANLGVVINKTKKGLTDDKWRGGSFGFSLTRIADFQNQISYEGFSRFPLDVLDNPDKFNDPNRTRYDFLDYAAFSTDLFASIDASGRIIYSENNSADDLAELAYQTYLIDAFPINGSEYLVERDIYAVDQNGNLVRDEMGNEIYVPAYPEEDYETRQRETIQSTGGVYQTSASYGGNYNDQLYFGASIGILSVNRDVERVYTENPTLTTLEQLTLIDNYTISGVGVNATFGVIARPITPLLLGVSYATPSSYSLEQTQETILQADYVRATDYRAEYEEYGFNYAPFSYNVTTPSRLRAGATYFFGKNGFITGDIERINYSGAKLRNAGDGFSFNGYNQEINQFRSVFNYRVGGEYRFGKFRLRAGYAYQDDPTSDNIDHTESRISFGGGIRTRNMYFDLGIINSLGRTSTISPYPGAPLAEVKNTNTTAIFSIGFFY